MASHLSKHLSPFFILLSAVNAQVSLPTLTGCVGNPAGTATFSTSLSLSTGTERIPAGDFWNQLGAIWIFSTDTEGIDFSQPGIPGYGAGFGGGGPPAAAESALVLDPSKTAWTLNVPTSSLGGEWDIVFGASSPTPSSAAASTSTAAASSPSSADSATSPSSTGAAASSPAAPATVAKRYDPARPSRFGMNEEPVPKTTTVASPPRQPQRPIPVGAKFRRQAASGQFNLIIKGSYPCLGPSPVTTGTASGNAQIASECVNNDISTNAAAWTTYGVLLFLSWQRFSY